MMSKRMNTTRYGKDMTTNAKPFCGHCKNIGKSEKEYTSHWPRASMKPGAPVTCPAILKTECTYCHQLGHWASVDHCPQLKLRKKEDAKQQRVSKQENQSKIAVKAVKPTNTRFGLLVESDSEDEEAEAEADEGKKFFAKPASPITPTKHKPVPSVAATPAAAAVDTKVETKENPILFIKSRPFPKKIVIIDGVERLVNDWTADSDSDDE
jgi:hypothetical protein